MSPAGPPRLAEQILRRLLVPQYRQFILDDLAEDYSALRAARGRGPADRWYWLELTRSFGASFKHRNALSRHSRRSPQRRSLMDVISTDARHALRRLVKAPGFTLAAVITLGLGIGANSAIFSVVNSVLIRPLPYASSDRLVFLAHTAPGLEVDEMYTSFGTYLHYRKHADTLEDSGLLMHASINLSGDGEPVRLAAAAVTHTLFTTLQVRPLHGRPFDANDDLPDTPSVVILNHGFWQRRFGADPNVVGTTVQLNGVHREVVGVMPAGFDFPRPGTDLWLPMKVSPDEIRFGGFFRLAFGRMRPGATTQQVAADIDALIPGLSEAYDVPPELIREAKLAAIVRPLRDQIVGDVRRSLWVILASVGAVLLIACANVANLFLLRAEGRHKEVAVRQALGASRAQLVRYFLSEAALLSVAGLALGLSVAWAGVRGAVVSGVDIPRLHEVSIDSTVLVVTAALAVLVGLVFGSFPILRYARPDLAGALKDDGRSTTSSRERQRGRTLLVGAQVAVALVLLVGSALMAQSFWRLSRVDPGFDADRVLAARLVLPDGDYPTRTEVASFFYQAIERMEALPGVVAAAVASDLPLSSGVRIDSLFIEGRDYEDNVLPPIATFRYVTPRYFEVMGIELREGRLFEQADDGSDAVMITGKLGRAFWSGESPLGRRAMRDVAEEPHWSTVVGIVSEVIDQDIAGEADAILYYPIFEGANDDLNILPSSGNLVLRTDGDPLALAGLLQQAIWELDPELPIANIRPMSGAVRDATARSRFTMTLLLIAAGVAVFLGAVGLYGVISYTVSQRTREIGVRMALGARAADVRRMILRQGSAVAIGGLAAGVGASWIAMRLLRNLLYEVSPADPLTYLTMAGLLLVVSLAATFLPARRAAAVDPAIGLRSD